MKKVLLSLFLVLFFNNICFAQPFFTGPFGETIRNTTACSEYICSSTETHRAACTRATDNSADEVDFQALHDALPSQGGKICLSAGDFTVTNKTTLSKDAITIAGEGLNATTIKLANGANKDMFVFDTDSQLTFFRFENLSIDGNKANNTSGRILWTGEGSDSVQDVHLVNTFFQNCADGYCAEIDDGWGFFAGGPFICEFANKHCLRIDSNNDWKILNAKIIANNGMAVHISNSASSYGKLMNSLVEGADGWPAVWLEGGSHIISGNTYRDDGSSETYGIKIFGNNNKHSDNTFVSQGKTLTGIVVASGASTNQITNDKFVGTASTYTRLFDFGTNTEVSGYYGRLGQYVITAPVVELTGQLGINKTGLSSQEKLFVAGPGNVDVKIEAGNSSVAAIKLYEGTNLRGQFYIDGSDNDMYVASGGAGDPMHFNELTSGDLHMVVGGGSVGIGAAPTAKLDVDGGIRPDSVTADPCGGAEYPAGTMFYNSTSNYHCYCNGAGADIKMNDNSTACF